MRKKMIMTMKPDVAVRYARCSSMERKGFVDLVRAELKRATPSAQIVGSINFSTRIVVDEGDVDRLRNGLSGRFLVENDYTMATL